jgi:hypothetical protein
MTIYLNVAFRDFRLVDAAAAAALPAAFFSPPDGYSMTRLEDKMDALEIGLGAETPRGQKRRSEDD